MIRKNSYRFFKNMTYFFPHILAMAKEADVFIYNCLN